MQRFAPIQSIGTMKFNYAVSSGVSMEVIPIWEKERMRVAVFQRYARSLVRRFSGLEGNVTWWKIIPNINSSAKLFKWVSTISKPAIYQAETLPWPGVIISQEQHEVFYLIHSRIFAIPWWVRSEGTDRPCDQLFHSHLAPDRQESSRRCFHRIAWWKTRAHDRKEPSQ